MAEEEVMAVADVEEEEDVSLLRQPFVRLSPHAFYEAYVTPPTFLRIFVNERILITCYTPPGYSCAIREWQFTLPLILVIMVCCLVIFGYFNIR